MVKRMKNKKENTKNIMVFAPHPDDDLIGCGGSIAKHVKSNNSVSIVYMTSGDAGSLKYNKGELSEIREKEAENAAKMIGVDKNSLFFLKNPDGYLEYNRNNLVTLINLIRDKKPNIVYVPHEKDAHKDHMKTNELVLESLNRASGPWFQECKGQPWSVGTILAYEVWTPLQEFQYSEDITDFIELKIKALGEHKSQIEGIKYDEAIKGLNMYGGIMAGNGKYCERFQVLKIDRI